MIRDQTPVHDKETFLWSDLFHKSLKEEIPHLIPKSKEKKIVFIVVMILK